MTPLKLRAITADKEDRLPPSIEVKSMAGNQLCTIWASGEVTFNCEMDYTIDELEQFVGLSKHFFTIYNNIISKDELIATLQSEKKHLLNEVVCSMNPIMSRQ